MKMELSRRTLFAGVSALLVARALVRASSLMPISAPKATQWWSLQMASYDGLQWFMVNDAFLLVGNGGAIRANQKYPHVRVESPTVRLSGPTFQTWSLMGAPSLASSIIKL